MTSQREAMTVGIDVREWVPERRTGIARFLEHVVAGLACEAVPILYANQSTSVPEPFGSLALRRIRERSTVVWDQVALPVALAHDRVDVFLSPYYRGPLVAPCPVVVTVHDLLFLDAETSADAVSLRRRAMQGAARRYAARATLVITDSEHWRGEIARRLRTDLRKIRVVPLGVDARFHRVANPEDLARVRVRYDVRAPYILYVGNTKPHKNLARLLRAFAAAATPAYQLVLAGPPDPSGGMLRETARHLGVGPRVRCTGLVAEDDLPALYAGATAFVFPSLAEGFGLPVLEAFACGVPVVASSTTSIPEVAGDAAVLVDPRDEVALAAAIMRLLEDPPLRQKLAEAGRARARVFTPGRTVAAVAAVLREAVGERRRSS
jgi:glycosyltransferase involved in cell wall biosynthesis